MLSIKNLTKIYRIRGANQVLALNNVSIDFPERGLIFVLGKSGCGKSTLLNLIGGLEKPTSGEIIINGKSTKHFKNKDFDFYRNTYIGFVFQEYNLINNLSIEDNISISLQFQGKQPDCNDIKESLKLVGLEELENRLPEELSGGQKQRIAIARALIKKPKIILADEPSGSLDSVSGKQVFDVLKEISKDRLVIVVSHDEDFANKYADRIINLKDGKIVKDIIKNKRETINDTEKHGELKKSNLPMKLAFKMGLHTLKLKPIRLSITVLLSVIAFTIFGLFSTLIFYDPAYSYSEAIKKENYSSVRLEKEYKYNCKYYRFDRETKEKTQYKNSQENAACGISMNDLNNLNNNSLGLNFAGIYNNDQNGFSYTSFINKRTNNEFYFYSNFSGLTDCGEDFLLNQSFKKIAGHYPQNYNEIAISTYALELFEDGGFKSSSGAIKAINNAEDILNCELELTLPHCYYAPQSIKLTICGVYDVGKEYNDKEFDLLKKYNIDTSNDPSFKKVSDKFKDAFTSCFYSLGFISEDFFDTYSSYLTPTYYAQPKIEYTQLYGMYIITPSEINTYKYNSNDDYYYSVSNLENCCFFEDVKEETNDLLFVDAFGNLITDNSKLDKDGIYSNILNDTFNDIVEGVTSFIESTDKAYYDRDGNVYFINEQKELITANLFINYDDLSLSFEKTSENSICEGVLIDDNGDVSCYCRTVFFNEDHSNYAFSFDSQHGDEQTVWFKNDGTLIGSVEVRYLAEFYYDYVNDKIYLHDDAVYSKEDGCYVLKKDDSIKLKPFDNYCVNKDGVPYEPDNRTNAFVGMFVNPNNGELSLIKKDGWLFTDKYFFDENGDIYLGEIIYDGKCEIKNNKKEYYLTYDGHPLGFTSFYKLQNCDNYFLDNHLDVAEAIIRYINFGGRFNYDEYIFKNYNFASLGGDFTASDLKLILNTYNTLKQKEDFRCSITGDYREFGVTTVNKTFSEVELKGFFIPYHDSTRADYVLNRSWANKSSGTSQERYSWSEERETKYIKDNNRYNYVICNTDKSQKEFAYLIKEYSDDSFYKIQNSLFNQIETVVRGTGVLKAIFFVAGTVSACLSIFLFANFVSNSISEKEKDIGVLRANGARGSDIFKMFFSESGILCVGCTALSIIVSSLCSIALNNGIAKGIKTSIIHFGILNVGVIIGIAILSCFLGMLFPILKISIKTPNQLIKNI